MIEKILFITWDGPQTNYMEGLFLPIFRELSKSDQLEFHVLQFTWGEKQKSDYTRKLAKNMGIHYTALRVLRKPLGPLGSLYSLFTGGKKICRYIKEHQIDIVMPRSNFPAFMVNQIKNKRFKIIFDADGLPIEERLDFSGLSKSSLQYKWLKEQETNMLLRADRIITRSQKSIEIHLNTLGQAYRDKFFPVYNGRDIEFFRPDTIARMSKRRELRIEEKDKVFVYCGSLGLQYGWEEMLTIFGQYEQSHPAKWLILTGNPLFAQERIPEALQNKIIVKKLPFHEVPRYLNIADVAFAIRQPTFSMQGVAPIKLGEYLLMGLPTIASKGIGDTDVILGNMPDCIMYDHHDKDRVLKVISWLNIKQEINHKQIRERAIEYFSLTAAATSYMRVLKSII